MMLPRSTPTPGFILINKNGIVESAGSQVENILNLKNDQICGVLVSDVFTDFKEVVAFLTPQITALHNNVQSENNHPQIVQFNLNNFPCQIRTSVLTNHALKSPKLLVEFIQPAIAFSQQSADVFNFNDPLILVNATEELNRTQQIQQVLAISETFAEKVFDTGNCAIALFPEIGSSLLFSNDEIKRQNYLSSIARNPWKKDDMQAKPMRISVSHNKLFDQHVKNKLRVHQIKQIVYFPLIGGRRILGALIIFMQADQPLQDLPLKFGNAFAHNVSTTIRRIYSQQRLHDSENKYRAIFENVVEGIYQSSKDGRFITVNPALIKMLGYDSEEEVMNLDLPRDLYVNAEDRKKLSNEVDKVGQLIDREIKVKRKDGSIMSVVMNDRAVRDEQGNFLYYEGTLVDVTEKMQAQKALMESENQLRAVINSSPDIIILKDASGKWLSANISTSRLLQIDVEQIIGMRDLTLKKHYPEHANFFENQLKLDEAAWRKGDLHRTQEVIQYGGEALNYDMVKVPTFDENGNRQFLVTIARDVTEIRKNEKDKRQLEQKILETQKLESLHVLAGGIAHDFNNLLVSILGNAGLALMELSPDSAARESLKQIETASQRAAELTKQLLAYSGKGKFVLDLVDLSDLVEEMVQLLEVPIPKNVKIVYDFEEILPPVEADPTQIRQIVMNLITNAAEAIGKHSGTIVIKTKTTRLNQHEINDFFISENLVDGGKYCVLEVSDSGCGMTEETLKRIFDPFYTTKFTGRGLGLAAVLGIVRGHKGTIRVTSNSAGGTVFHILLPASNKKVRPKHEELVATSESGTRKKILVVDDEDSVRNVACRILQQYCYEPHSTKDGYEALRFLRDNEDIALVLLDMTMPGLDGEATYREIHKMYPDLKVILSSGFSEQEAMNKFAGRAISGFIQKPYKPIELAIKVQTILRDFQNA